MFAQRRGMAADSNFGIRQPKRRIDRHEGPARILHGRQRLSMGDLRPCGLRWLTGLPCPLCGGTHAVSLLLHADAVSAVQANAGVTALAVLALSACGLLLLEALTARRWLAPERRQTLARRALTGCAAILALNWVAALGR